MVQRVTATAVLSLPKLTDLSDLDRGDLESTWLLDSIPKTYDWPQLGAPQQKQEDEQEGCPSRGRRATGERTPRLPVRCVENANGLRAGSSAEGRVVGVETSLCPLGSSSGGYGRPVAGRQVVVRRSSTRARSQGSRALHTTTRAGKES